jgi:hypothetical protein
MKSKGLKFEEKLRNYKCPKCKSTRIIPRYPGARFKAVRCMDCGLLGVLEK